MLSERQIQIRDEATKLIASKGIQGFTIKNLSKAIGISEPGLYRHFESKVDILSNILIQFDEMADLLSERMKNENIDAIKKITLFFENMFSSFVKTPSFVSVIFSEEIFKNEKVLKNIIVKIQNKNQNTIEQIIADGQKNNEIRKDINKHSLSYIIMGSLTLIVKKWDLNNYNFNLKVEGKTLLDALKKMLIDN